MRKLILEAVLILMASGAQAATLNVLGGQLMGASGVDVGGSLYDVQFLDGTCIDLYSGCDDVSDFTFQTQFYALLAALGALTFTFLRRRGIVVVDRSTNGTRVIAGIKERRVRCT